MIANIFYRRGGVITTDPKKADIIVWTGGTDVNPQLYGEPILRTTMDPDRARDSREMELWRIAQPASNVLKVGICRGGQFLNVMNGGKLWQDVDQHGRTHPVTDVSTGKTRLVSSTHHQQFRPASDAVIVAYAQLSTRKDAHHYAWRKPVAGPKIVPPVPEAIDYEVLWYPKTRTLCFQPHPEYDQPEDTEQYFFELIERYF